MKILEICPFSAGICGVWTRVLSESKEFTKLGNEVIVFSSDIEKGTGKKVLHEEKIKEIQIKRFNPNQDFLDKLVSGNVTYFNFEKEFINLKPEIVITHLLHPHSFKALRLCKQQNIPCYLITHAPFNVQRNFILSILTKIYYSIKVKSKLNNFTKIIAITKWEIPYLKKLGIPEDKIIYIPNGVPEEFFRQKKQKTKKQKDVLFLGRIAPVKNIELLIKTAKNLPEISFSVVGPAEEKYLKKLKYLIGDSSNISILPPVYDLKEKIKLIDEHKIFVLPSKREAMPQVLIEAMARGKIIISSQTDGGKEIINDNRNGFLFEIGNSEQLVDLIKKNIKGNKQIQNQAKKDSEKYSWKNLIKKYQEILN